MIAALALTTVLVPFFMLAVRDLERWSNDREARLARIRAEDAVFTEHRGADESFAVELRKWRKAGLGSAVAR
jgi:hypothetical protein